MAPNPPRADGRPRSYKGTRDMPVVGVDGCRDGWFAIRVGDNVTDLPVAGVFPTVRSLLDTWDDASLVLIDIPIGLPDTRRPSRKVDVEARRLLGSGRASSVFPAPGRAAVNEFRSHGPDSYNACAEANRQELGKSLSKQAFGILPKIAEVDQLLLSDEAARSRIREVHPEVCFWGLNGRRSMTHRKKDAEGIDERLEVLNRVLPWADSTFRDALKEHPRRVVQRDDILDALAAVTTAVPTHPLLSEPQSILTEPEVDARGLPMEMLYRLPRSLI